MAKRLGPRSSAPKSRELRVVTRARLGQRSGLGSGNSPRLEIPSFLFRHDDPAESPRAGQRRNAEPYALPPRSLKLHLSGGLVFVQPLEARVSQQVIGGPVHEVGLKNVSSGSRQDCTPYDRLAA